MTERQKYNILIVDDTETHIDLLLETLGEDYDISVAMDGKSALENIALETPDLILLDIMMPEMDGFEVLRRLKKIKTCRDVPVIFVTVKGEEQNETKGFQMGAVDYISKPFSPPIVKARIETQLELKNQRDQLKNSISFLQHEAEILKQKADIGIEAGALAHDINNVLMMNISSELFIRKRIPHDLPERSEIEEKLDQIHNNIMLGSKICKGYTSYIINIGGEAFAQPVPPLLQPLDIYSMQYKGELEQNIPEELPLVKCKGYQLKRVFYNLFINACQAMENQEDQKITIRMWREKGAVMFSMKDKGPAIPEEIIPRIFDESFSTKPDGTGLGLFLVKQIMDDHKGTVAVSSDKQGTIFTLSFPVFESE
ncbi:MAG: response regulator [Desulfobacterales bacterium]|nr:response regulator [Desulfobacterales bacterium]MCP4159667.1 response regulator [Deltaproteobacteria bacterium]